MRYSVALIIITVSIFIAACSGYDVKVIVEPAAVGRGESGEIRIQLEASGKYHLEPEGLVIINLAPPSFIKMDKTEYRQEDKKTDNSFSIPFTVISNAPLGIASVKVDITFQLCTSEQCLIIEEHKEAKIKVR